MSYSCILVEWTEKHCETLSLASFANKSCFYIYGQHGRKVRATVTSMHVFVDVKHASTAALICISGIFLCTFSLQVFVQHEI